MKIKNIIAILLVIIMTFSFCACGNRDNNDAEGSKDNNQNVVVTPDVDNTEDTTGSENEETTTPDTDNESTTTPDTSEDVDDVTSAEYAKKVSNFIYVPEYIYDEDTHAFHNELKNIVIFDESTAKYAFKVECKPETRIIKEVETFGYNIKLVNENGTVIGAFFYVPNTYTTVRLDNYGIQKVVSQVDEWNFNSVIKTNQEIEE